MLLLSFAHIFLLSGYIAHVHAGCYFPHEFLGEFTMQSAANMVNGVQYGPLNITTTSIPIWGNCHRRIGNNFILIMNFRGTSCFRCLHLKLRSPNVLQVFTLNKEVISKCHINEQQAEADCPYDDDLNMQISAEILLFKIKDSTGAPTVKQYCPIDGKYFVEYQGNALKDRNCLTNHNVTMDACPSGSVLNLRSRNCNHDIKFECLGNWRGPSTENYLVFTDNRPDNHPAPKYRCALYTINEITGVIHMGLSSDSTCSTDLINSTHAYETLTLRPRPEHAWPVEVINGICRFPGWMVGHWEHLRITSDTMIYKDHNSLKTYIIKCVSTIEDENKMVVFTRTQCDEESFRCMQTAKRGTNILEFQLGTRFSNVSDAYTLCAESSFSDEAWITQGRLHIIETHPKMCPISGEYVGVIPDSSDLCAKLWSDCRTFELMYYQVSHCETKEIYEEREYRCLGHWQEIDLLYTYTQRSDVAAGTYECFVGAKMSDKEIYIREAGEHCQRNSDPLHYGMALNKTEMYSCLGHYPTRRPHTTTTTTRTKVVNISRTPVVIKSWDFNADHKASGGSSPVSQFTIVILKALLTMTVSVACCGLQQY